MDREWAKTEAAMSEPVGKKKGRTPCGIEAGPKRECVCSSVFSTRSPS